MTPTTRVDLSPAARVDLSPATAEFARDVIAGFTADQKWISSKYFYDAHGSALFDAITELQEYYPTRTEVSIVEASASSMAERIGRDAVVVEYGRGSSTKIRLLLDALEAPAAYVPIDVSQEHLLRSAASIAADSRASASSRSSAISLSLSPCPTPFRTAHGASPISPAPPLAIFSPATPARCWPASPN